MNAIIATPKGTRRGRGGSPVSPTEAKKRATAHLTGKQQQNAGEIEKQGDETAPAPKKPGRPPRQKQDAGETSRQGTGTKTQDKGSTQALGAVREVGGIKIEVMPVPSHSGGRALPETYPFSQLAFCTVGNDGSIVGESIFIPETDNPQKHLTAARKRVKGTGVRYMMRKMSHEGKDGMRFWRHKEA